MNRQEHLQWSKDRAIQILNEGDYVGAYSSFLSDMNEHNELKDHIALQLGLTLMMMGKLSTQTAMKKFIEDFN